MRKIEQFLPPRYRTKSIKNFMNSTTNQLFSEKDAVNGSYYIGKKPSGLFQPGSDFYATEIRKIREDYQLEPAFIIRDTETGGVQNSIFYEDILNVLRDYGCSTKNHNDIFRSDTYSYAPPIDPDMFINYRDYYWYPEGVPAISIIDDYADIVGNINKVVVRTLDNNGVSLSNGMFVKLTDNKTYIVSGVGSVDGIQLTDFDYSSNTQQLLNYSSNEQETSALIKHPKEYILMERGSIDKNTWSRGNMWFHKDAITFSFAGTSFKPSIERRAERPIICFDKNIALYNYDSTFVGLIDYYTTGSTYNSDGVYLNASTKRLVKVEGGTVVSNNPLVEGRYTISSGDNVGNEYSFRDGTITLLQSKYNTNIEPLFDMFDINGVSIGDDLKYPDSTFNGNKIFSYNTSDMYGVHDSVLNKNVVYKAFKESSDLMFVNCMTQDYGIGEYFYKSYNTKIENNIIKFTINSKTNVPTIFVNNEEMPQLVVFANTKYLLDFTDISTTADGWFAKYRPIKVYSDVDTQFVEPTHAYSRNNKVEVMFDMGQVYYYSDGENTGKIIVRSYDDTEYTLHGVWKKKGIQRTKLYQNIILDKPDQEIELAYNPIETNITVMFNGVKQEQRSIIYKNNKVILENSKEGDYLEIRYTTNAVGVSSEKVAQEVTDCLTKNPYNEDVTQFAYSEVFNHFISIITNQSYVVGSALSSNNYRDTIKDRSVGDVILRHSSNFPLLAYMLSDSDINLLDSIKYSAIQYEMFKRSLIVGTEERMRKSNIDIASARSVLDDILLSLNGLKTSEDSFSTSHMIAAYRKYESIVLDSNNTTNIEISFDYNNAIYVYTKNGLALINIDYDVIHDSLTGKTEFVFKTFSRNDLVDIRYYTDIEPTFAPATPAKFGLSKPKRPTMYIEQDIYRTPQVMIVGHDGSLTRAYTPIDDYQSNIIDARDLVLLEYESRVYNSINQTFKLSSGDIVNYTEYRKGKFRKSSVLQDKLQEQELVMFNKWATENYLDYTKNTSYVSNDPFSYNYGYSVDVDGNKLPGNWKGIYLYYYDTITPNKTPWEMLGFDIKPEWWDVTYGTDYSSNNTAMWGDLEEGIIRAGERKNTENGEYLLNSNLYRREGLSTCLPVDENGNIKDPVAIGITTEPSYEQAKSNWKFGDLSPVEFAWRSTSEYQFVKQQVMFIVDPLMYISRTWNTHENYSVLENPKNKKPHSVYNYATGLSHWVYDYLKFKKMDANKKLNDSFQNQEVLLAHKVGGYIDSDELRVFTESYNPLSTTNNTLIPQEDISVSLYESRELGYAIYSGVLVERVENTVDIMPYVNGAIYNVNDVVVNIEDNMFYQYKMTNVPTRWSNATFYIVGSEVVYNNTVYVSKEAHRAKNENNPLMDSNIWEVKTFKSNEWNILNGRPKSKKTLFKVTGYDVNNPYFTTVKGNPIGRKKLIKTPSRISKPLNYVSWDSNIEFSVGDTFQLNNGRVIVMTEDGISDYEPVTGTYRYKDDVDTMTNMLRQQVLLDPLVVNDEVQYELVQYGTVFKDVNALVNFLMAYSRHLEMTGFVFDSIDQTRGRISNWEMMCEDTMQWASEASDIGSFITLSPSATSMKYRSKHGVSSIVRGFDDSKIRLLNHKYQPIYSGFEVLRLDNTFTMTSDEPVFYAVISNLEYEHAIYVNNKTIFGDVNFDPVYGNRKERFKISTTKTQSWDGRLAANGYIVLGGNIMANFETSVDEVSKNSDLNYMSTLNIVNKLKRHNIGFQERAYFNELEFETASQVEFYKGFIRQKGAYESINRFLRSDSLANDSKLDVYEEWAFKVADFGGTFSNQTIELKIDKDTVRNNPALFILEYNDYQVEEKSNSITYIGLNNDSRWIKKPTRLYGDNLFETVSERNSNVKSAGFVNWDYVTYRSYSLNKLDGIITKTNTIPEISNTAWIARSDMNSNNWDILQYQNSNIQNANIYNHGVKDKCSFIITTTAAINQDDIYGFYDNGHIFTFSLKHIKDSYYIAISLSGEVLILNDELTTISLGIWKSLRFDTRASVDNSVAGGLLVAPTTRFYIGDEKDWYVLDSNYDLLYKKGSLINPDKIQNILIYDQQTLDVIRSVRVFDPLKGIYPTDVTQYIDYKVDYNPANYTASHGYSTWGSNKVGTLWWDTSTITYLEYEMDSNDYRSRYWGAMFPGSSVDIYEWVESYTKPEEGTEYVSEKFYNSKLGIENTKYYFWVKNKNTAPTNSKRRISALEIANQISNSHRTNGYSAIISNNAILINDVDSVFQSDVVIQINYKLFDSKSDNHTEWNIFGEFDELYELPQHLYTNMLNSLVENDGRDVLPYPHLPESDRYGNKEGQTWFKNTREARRIFAERINTFMNTLNWWDIDLFWESNSDEDIYNSNYYDFKDWYTDGVTEISFIPNIVTSRNDLLITQLDHNELVKVVEEVGRMPSVYRENSWTIYRYDAIENTYVKVAQSKSILQFNNNFINGGFSIDESNQLRKFIDIMFNVIMVEPYHKERNSVMFALIRYIMSEQEATDWFFPTSYISVSHRATELIQKSVYQLDKEEQIKAYIEEAKPFHTKLREYNKKHNAPMEYSGMYVTDFDKPPFVTAEDRDIIILQEKHIEKLIGDGVKTNFTTTLPIFFNTSKVFVDGRLVDRSEYQITTLRNIIFFEPPFKGRNLIKNIVIETPNDNHIDIIKSFRDTKYGYNDVYNEPLSTWINHVNQKKHTLTYDRVSILPTLVLEDILPTINGINSSDKPLENFTKQSNAMVNRFTEIERVISKMCYDELVECVNNTSSFVGNRANYVTTLTDQNIVVMIENEIVPKNLYTTSIKSGKVNVKLNFTLEQGKRIFFRNKDKFDTLINKVYGMDDVVYPMHTFKVEAVEPFVVETNENKNIVVNTYEGTFDDIGQTVTSSGTFIEPDLTGIPEELVGTNIKETIVMSSVNNFSMINRGFNGVAGQTIFSPISYVQANNRQVVPITLNVNPEQILVMVDNEEWSMGLQYNVTANSVNFIRVPRNGQRVVITDRFAAFDMYPDTIKNLHKNINIGGFDGNVVVPDFMNTKEDRREFIVYSGGNTYFFEEVASNNVTADITINDNILSVDGIVDVSDDNNLFVIYAQEIVTKNNKKVVASSVYEFVTLKEVDGEIHFTKRGLFNGDKTNMEISKYNITLMKLSSSNELPSLTIVEPYIGNHRNHYPKYGHIVVGKDNLGV